MNKLVDKANELMSEGFDVAVTFKGGAIMRVDHFTEDGRVVGQFIAGDIGQIHMDEIRASPACLIVEVKITA